MWLNNVEEMIFFFNKQNILLQKMSRLFNWRWL